MVRELKADEFTERLRVISEPVFRQVERDDRRRESSIVQFYPRWRNLMELGMARTWELSEGAVLGALFAPDIYRGTLTGIVLFWHCTEAAKKSGKALELLKVFEEAARVAGCERICSSAHSDLRHDVMCRFLKMRGYSRLETVFCKDLWAKSSEQ